MSLAVYMRTPYGRQRVYMVGTIKPIVLELTYDFDAGILLGGVWEGLMFEEAFFKLVGLDHMGYCRLVKTNVDLRPVDAFHELMRLIINNLPLVLFVVALAASLVLMRRRGRRR